MDNQMIIRAVIVINVRKPEIPHSRDSEDLKKNQRAWRVDTVIDVRN